ncbi:8-oxoguanine glycosylase ogg1 [Modicella reniformis]|uniref:DNA-(apurinic or apyrimidinic site) lyase n=1 Tax=Modicella reniformis TaxID=1440133 RepID=A0A9P6IKR6_9FUNG|nr:8-oxoguanine glycosylase ogg1 [Modicella reniformis]
MAALSRITRRRALSAVKEATTTTTTISHTPIVVAKSRNAKVKVKVKVVISKDASISPSTAPPKPAGGVGVDPSTVTAAIHVRSTPWTSVKMSRSELTLPTTLKCGQSFRWQREHYELDSGQISAPRWSCVLGHRLWCIQETEDGFQYRTFRQQQQQDEEEEEKATTTTRRTTTRRRTTTTERQLEHDMEQDKAFLWDYFQLHVPLTELYDKWSKTDTNFSIKALVSGFYAKILANNNIGRISQMATKICQEYGPSITIPPEEPGESPRKFYGFPTMNALAQDGVEETLRKLGFGYRAKYIANTAKMISTMENGEEWLKGLRNVPYEEAHSALLTLQGVGPKVADCVCLMSLDKHNIIPVDTHVWQIAVRDYQFRYDGKVPKTISSAVYKAVGKHFFNLFGDYSGWAHTVLFVADLRTVEGLTKMDPGESGLVVVKVKQEEEESTLLLAVPIEQDSTTTTTTILKREMEETGAEKISSLSLKEEEEKKNKDATAAASSSRSRRQSKRSKREHRSQ